MIFSKFIRHLRGSGLREKRADELINEYAISSAPPETRNCRQNCGSGEACTALRKGRRDMEFTIGLVAVLNALGYLAVVWAFRASFRQLQTATWWFATGFMILAGAIICRGMWWDVSMPLARLWAPEWAAWWTDHVGRYMNLVFGLMKMAAFYCALKCRQLLIPEAERQEWPLWKAWLHPTGIRVIPWR